VALALQRPAFLGPLGRELLKGISLKASWRTDGTRSSQAPLVG
jgi:hypothetical protein